MRVTAKSPWALAGICGALCLAPAIAIAEVEIEWWHAMDGVLGEKVQQIADRFNARQSDYELTPVFKGNYSETLGAANDAFETGDQPHIIQVFDVGTASMMAAEDAIYPVHQLMADAEAPFGPTTFLPAVQSYFSDEAGNLLALPFNVSTPVLYVNRNAFIDANLDPDAIPATWPDFADALSLIQQAGKPCGFTTAWQSWIQLENFSAWHDVPFMSREELPFGTLTELVFDAPAQTAHITALAQWSETDLFRYAGRQGASQNLFLSGTCAAYFASSVAYATLTTNADFDVGVAPLPFWPDITDTPRNTTVGGAALWVLQGHDAEDYAGVADVIAYLASDTVQVDWHYYTGYLPVTRQAYTLSRNQGFYDANPGMEVAVRQVANRSTSLNSGGVRLERFVEIRSLINEELEAVWNGQKPADLALRDAAARGTVLLLEKAQEAPVEPD